MARPKSPHPRVWVVERVSRGKFVLRWEDPRTNRRRQRTAAGTTKAAAYKEAGLLEEELKANGGSDSPPNAGATERWTWDQFCTRYRQNYLEHTSRSNRYKWTGMVAVVDAEFKARGIADPLLTDVTPELLEAVEQRLLAKGNSASTAASGMATLRSGLSWAAGLGMIPPIPTPRKRGRAKEESSEMRGRPITQTEFDTLLQQFNDTDEVKCQRDRWKHLVRGLWLSGMRISEALWLHTDRLDCHRVVNLHTDRPAIIFLNRQKNRKDQMVAMTPDFAAFLRETEAIDGWFFNPWGPRGRYRTSNAVGRVIGAVGEEAGIVTVPGETVTAHDLRRSFAQRWAARVMPPILQHLMRHQSIQTTMQFYVGSDATSAASTIREAWLNSPDAQAGPVLCDQACDQLSAA